MRVKLLSIIFFLALCVTSFLGNPSFAKAPFPKGVGVCAHFDGAPPTRDLDLIQQAGFTILRTDLKWAQVESTRGTYNWSKYDAIINGLLARGIRPYMILDYNNYNYGSSYELNGISGSTQVTGYKNFAAAAAARYKGKGVIWEIWNEPNLDQFWAPTNNVNNYMIMAKAAIPAMRTADPDSYIVAPAVAFVANTFSFLDACGRQGLFGLVDAVSVHPYKNARPEAGDLDYLYNGVRNLIRQYNPANPNLPIVGGEHGYSVAWSGQTETTQGNYNARQVLYHLSHNIPVSMLYDFKNDGTNAAEPEHNFGLLKADYTPKLAYTNMKTLNNTLNGATFNQRINLSSSNDYCLKFTKGTSTILALWTTGSAHNVTVNGTTVNISEKPVYVVTGGTTTNPTPTPTPEPTPTPAPAPEPTPVPTGSFPKGIGVNVKFSATPTRDLDLIQQTGFTIARTELKWSEVESTKGTYNWAKYDAIINGLLSRGVKPYMMLGYNNRNYLAETEVDAIDIPEQVNGYKNFVVAAANRYKGKGIIWEIWNEPNLDQFWAPAMHSTNYMNLVKAVVPAIKAADPTSYVVAPAVAFVANTFTFLEDCGRQGLFGMVDAVSVHPYKNAAPESGTLDYLYNTVRSLITKYNPANPNLPIIGGEFGFSSTWTGVNETIQGNFLSRQVLYHNLKGVPVSIINSLVNNGRTSAAADNFGILRADYTQKKAYNVIKTLNTNLKDATFEKRLPASSTKHYYLQFSQGTNKILALWTTGSPTNVTINGQTIYLTQTPVYVKI